VEDVFKLTLIFILSVPDRGGFYLEVSGVLSPPKLYKSGKNTSWAFCINSKVPWWHSRVKIREQYHSIE